MFLIIYIYINIMSKNEVSVIFFFPCVIVDVSR